MGRDRVFLDTSILIAAVISSRGGSFYILDKLKNNFTLQISKYVLEEAMRTLTDKFPNSELMKSKLLLLLGLGQVEILDNPPKRETNKLKKVISEKDTPVLTSALEHSSYLITFDNEFLGEDILRIARSRGLKIMKPREFVLKFKS